MSRVVDERVVSMQFDNKQFESNVATSMSTLEKLKQSLNLKGASKGLENVNSVASKFNLAPIGNAVETVGLKFNAMYTIADQALRNITTRVQQTAENMIKAFTIEPIKSGLQEYETQINSVQTILANTESKGSTLDDVNSALDELNSYADKTIYNFTEMTRNIGTFTAAGVDLDKSVTSIKGIANLAAVSGSTSQQASTAMYQLSQALASGKVQLMDWNSVVNAGMGGQVFQDALKRTATQMGTNVDELIKKYGSFRESLTQGEWLTADVLTETLTQLSGAYSKAELIEKGYTEAQADEIVKLADTAVNAATKVKTFTQLMDTLKEAAQSGWTQTWEILIGDFEEAKELWTGVSDTIGDFINKTNESRNNMLEGAMVSNWDKLIGKINEAGIQTTDFESKIKDVLKDHEIDVDKVIEKHGSLEEAFKSGSLSSDLLKEAVDGLSTSLSGLSKIEKDVKKGASGDDVKAVQEALKSLNYDIGKTGADGIFGAKTEAAIKEFQKLKGLKVTGIVDKETLAALDEATKKTHDLSGACGALINDITKLGGRELLIDSLKNVFEGLLTVVKPIKRAFSEVFPPVTSEQLYKLLEGFRDFTEKLRLTGPQVRKLYVTFKGFFSAISIGASFIKELVGGIVKLLGNFSGLVDGVLNITSAIGGWFTKLRQTTKETDVFGTAVDSVVSFLQNGIDAIKAFGSAIRDKFKSPGFEGFFGLMKGIWDVVTKIGGKVAEIGSSIGNALATAFSSGDLGAAMDILNGGLFASLLLSVKKFVGQFTESAEDGFGLFEKLGSIVDGVKETLDTVRSSLETWQTSLKAGILLKIAMAIGVLAASIWVISGIDPGKLAASLGAITLLFGELMGSLAIFTKISGNFSGVTKASVAMIAVSASILILSFALKNLSSLDWEGIGKGLVGITGLAAIVVATSKILGTGGKSVIKGAMSMVVFAAAMKILAGVCKDMSVMSWDEMKRGLTGVGVMMGAVAAFLLVAKYGKMSLSTATGIVVLAASMKILASACKDFASMGVDELQKGLTAIGVLLLEIGAFTMITGNAKRVLSTGVALIAIGAAMKIFASAVNDFGGMNWDQLIRGLTGMGVALAAVTIAMRFMPKNTIGIGAGLVVVSAALLIMAEAVSRMGGMSYDQIGKGLLTLGVSLAVLAVSLKAMNGTLGGSAALLIASVSLTVLASALKKMGSMGVGEIVKSLVTLAAALAIIGFAGAVLGPVVPALLGLAGAMALIGVAVATVGIGLAAAALGLTALATAGAAGATAIVAALTIIVTGIAGLIPVVVQKLGEAVVVFAQAIAASADALGAALKTVVLALIDVLVQCVPALADGLLKLISEVLASLAKYTPQIIESLFTFLIGVLDGLAAKLPELIQSAVNLVMQFFSGVVDALSGIDVNVLLKGIAGVGLMAGLMIVLGAVAGLVPGAMVGVLGMGAVIAELALVIAAIGGLAQIPGFSWLIGEGAAMMQQIGNAIGGFVGGIIGGVAEGITASLPQIGTDLSTFMTNLTPFIDGAKQVDESMMTGVKSIADIIMTLTAANILEGLTSWFTGGSSLSQFGAELVPFGLAMATFSSIVSGNVDEGAVTATANAGRIMAEMASTIPNSGGVVGFFAGENDLGTFATQLVPFATAMASFSSIVSGNIDEGAVTAAANAGKAMAEMAATLPNSGGVVGFFAGENDMSTFASQLVPFATGITSFSSIVTGSIDEGAVTAAANAGAAMVEMASTIPNTGGLVSWFTGDNDMATFGSQLVIFGSAMVAFSSTVSGSIDEGAVTAAANAGSMMAQMASTIPNTGGLVSWFTGDNDMATFGTQLVAFGEAISDFSDEVSGIDESAVTAAANAGSAMSAMANSLPNTGGIASWFSGDNDMKTFGKHLVSFGEAISDFSEEVKDIDNSAVTSAATAGKTMTSMAKTLSGLSDTSSLGLFGDELAWFGEGLVSFSNKVSGMDASATNTAITNAKALIAMIKDIANMSFSGVDSLCDSLSQLGGGAVDSFVNSFKNSEAKVSSAATDMIKALVTSFTAKGPAIGNTLTMIVTQASSVLKSQYSNFYNAGKFLVQGFADGITINTFKATASARAMANKAYLAAKEALNVNSPSKLFRSLGYTIPEGLAVGIDRMGGLVADSSAAMARTAFDGTKNVIARIADNINSDIDAQPTIRPVIDLTNVKSGASSINDMLSMKPSVGVMSSLGSIGMMMNARVQNGTNDDVISAINDLGKKLGNSAGNTYNVNGITYDDGSNIVDAVQTLVRAAKVERRI